MISSLWTSSYSMQEGEMGKPWLQICGKRHRRLDMPHAHTYARTHTAEELQPTQAVRCAMRGGTTNTNTFTTANDTL